MLTSLEFFTLIATFILSGVFLVSGGLKARSVRRFADGIRGYRFLPGRLVTPAAYLVVAAELCSACLLIGGAERRWTAAAILLMLAAFAAVVTPVILRGDTVACLCFGSATERVSWWTLARLGGLAALTVLTAAGPPLPAAWTWVRSGAIGEVSLAALLAGAVLVGFATLVSAAGLREVRQ